MPQRLWRRVGAFRMCEVCKVYQVERDGKFLPPVAAICPGDNDDDGARPGRRRSLRANWMR